MLTGLSTMAQDKYAFYFFLCSFLARDWCRFGAYGSRLQFHSQPFIITHSIRAGRRWNKIKRFAHIEPSRTTAAAAGFPCTMMATLSSTTSKIDVRNNAGIPPGTDRARMTDHAKEARPPGRISLSEENDVMMEDGNLGRFDHVCHHRHDSSSHRRPPQLKEKEVFQTVHLERGVEDVGERSCISENNWMMDGGWMPNRTMSQTGKS